MEQQHSCEAVAVHCIDFRLQKAISKFLGKRFPGGYDRIAVAGGVKDLVANGENSLPSIPWRVRIGKKVRATMNSPNKLGFLTSKTESRTV